MAISRQPSIPGIEYMHSKDVGTIGELAVILKLKQAGPNGYLRKYKDDVDTIDFFALYIHDTSQVAYISAKEAFESCPGSTRLIFPVDPTLNKHERGVRYLKNYTDFEGVLRDYEQRA